MKLMFKAGFREGAVGAFILAVMIYGLTLFGVVPEAIFITNFKAVFGDLGLLVHPLAIVLYLISGGIWGFIFTLIPVKKSYLSGTLYGIIPTLWLWIMAFPSMGLPMFGNGDPLQIIGPLVFNLPIWGGFVGYRLSKLVALD